MKFTLSIILIIIGLFLIIPSLHLSYMLMMESYSHKILITETQSMEPTFYKNDTLKIVIDISGQKIHANIKDSQFPGDIIAFHLPGNPDDIIVHRAIEKKDNGDGTYSFKTRGDSNIMPDPFKVHENYIIGKLIEVNPPFWTYDYQFWRITFFGANLLIGIGLFVISKNHVH